MLSKPRIIRKFREVHDTCSGSFTHICRRNLKQIYSGEKGGDFTELHRVIMNLKGWLRGVHHYVKDLQDYLDEYSYRFNRSFMKEGIFENLMIRMVNSKHCFIKNISN